MLASLFQPVKVPDEVVTNAGNKIIEAGGLVGALLVVSVILNIVLVWVVIRVQNARVTDNAKIAQTAEKMVTTFASVDNALGNLNKTNETQSSAIQTLTQTVNTVLMQAMAMGRGPTMPPHSGGG